MAERDHRDQRRQLRALALAHHPDRGGDPEKFISGLAALLSEHHSRSTDLPTLYRRRRGLAGWLGLGRPRSPKRSLD